MYHKPASAYILTLQLNNRDLTKRRPKGDLPKIFVIIQRGPAIEAVRADLANADFCGRIKQTREDSRDELLTVVMFLPVRDHGAVVWADP